MDNVLERPHRSEKGAMRLSNKAKIREEAKKLNPIDDVFFQVMAEDRLVCQEILRTVLNDPGLEVVRVTPQRELRNLQGRSVRLDAECILGNGKHANVEVQKSDNDDHQRRVRYNASCLTTNITDPGVKFKKVPDVIMVYITRFDIFRGGKTTYHVERTVKETGKVVHNGLTEIYVNAAVDDGTDTAELMKIFVQDDSYDMEKFPHVSQQKRYLKEDQEGVRTMTGVMEKMLSEERAEGQREGHRAGKTDTIVGLVREGILTIADAAVRLSLSEEEIMELLDNRM